MAVLTVLLLALTFLFLAYRHPLPVMQKYMPRWLRESTQGGEEANRPESATLQGEAVQMKSESKVNAAHDDSDCESTPKASASKVNGAVPSISLNAGDEDEKGEVAVAEPSAPSFPAANSAQRASVTQPATNATRSTQQKSASTLMPPPPRPTSVARGPPPNSAASLRIPTTGPLPNRGPPANSQQRVSGSLAPNAAVQTPNGRNKFHLKPGHSPMDWAALTRSSSSNLSGVSTFQRVTPSQLRKMTGRKGKDAWSSWQGKVYNITPYVDFHPGGGPEIMKAAGRDGEKLFMETHPWVNWENMLGTCLVGVMVPEGYHDVKGDGKQESELEGLD